jgi:hypothetical protein
MKSFTKVITKIKLNKMKIVAFIITVVILYTIYYFIEWDENAYDSILNRTINKDGFVVFENMSDQDLKRETLSFLPKDYIFIKYKYNIKNTSLYTFHRDVTSSQYIYDTEYPIYTLIKYNYDGQLLSLCPGSNYSYPFTYSNIVNIHGTKGTCFLFNSDVLHAGCLDCLNNNTHRSAVQYKICHINDLSKLTHLNNVNVKKDNDKANVNVYTHFMRKMSYFMEFPINYFLYPIMEQKKYSGVIGFFQTFIPIRFYNNA